MSKEISELELNIKYLQSQGIRVKNAANIGSSGGSTLQLKDFDTNKGIVSFYFSNFNSKDSDNDIIKQGAFTKTIQENRKRIKHLKNHNMTQAPGTIIDIAEDSVGAYAVSQLVKSTLGRDTLLEYEGGVITEHSMGFQVIKEQFDQFSGANIIQEVKLWEVSSLTAWGANENTPVIGVKSEEEILKQLQSIESLLKSSNLSDERAKELYNFSIKLSEQLKSFVKEEIIVNKFSLKDIISEIKI